MSIFDSEIEWRFNCYIRVFKENFMGYKSLILLCSGIILAGNCLAEVELRWGIDEVLAHQIRIAREVKEKIEKKTNGEVRVKIELYGEEHLKSPQKERFDIHQTIVGNYSERVPELKIWEIPYLFQNKAHVEAYMTSSRGQATLAKIEDEKWLPINYSYAGGFLHFYSKKKISNFSDFQQSASCNNQTRFFLILLFQSTDRYLFHHKEKEFMEDTKPKIIIGNIGAFSYQRWSADTFNLATRLRTQPSVLSQ